MTVKEAVAVLKTAKKIVLGYGDNAVPFEKDDPLVMEAYGVFIVDKIHCEGDGYYEINIAMRPVREGGV